MSKTTGSIPNSIANAFICRPKIGEVHRVRNEVEFHSEAIEFATKYNLTIKTVGKLKSNGKFTITYIKYKEA